MIILIITFSSGIAIGLFINLRIKQQVADLAAKIEKIARPKPEPLTGVVRPGENRPAYNPNAATGRAMPAPPKPENEATEGALKSVRKRSGVE